MSHGRASLWHLAALLLGQELAIAAEHCHMVCKPVLSCDPCQTCFLLKQLP